ncbi:MAG: cupin protein [Firmicutes bacterium]|nr:cupin protein [Bacillota bacterium]
MLSQNYRKPLFIFEMANNHQGSVEHGQRVIKEIAAACDGFDFDFAFKFQYRDLDTFIHPNYKNNKDLKQVKRFEETRLAQEQFLLLKDEVEKHGFLTICTPFDEVSVGLIEQHRYAKLKIASCSFTDWPLLERIAQSNLPIIASTAGAELVDIDNVVSFFRHRGKDISLMHCVAEYPTMNKDLQLNQIEFLRSRYPGVSVGYSTHEQPSNTRAVQLAIAKGAVIFEKHVGVACDGETLNSYSANPTEVRAWLLAAKDAYEMCGIFNQHRPITEKEKADLQSLRRGVFASKPIKKGDKIDAGNTFFAIPSFDGQLLANDMSKYKLYHSLTDIEPNQAIYQDNADVADIRPKILNIVNQVKSILKDSGVPVPEKASFELSHHYGLDNFDKYGVTIVNCINREYCKKILVVIPNQDHPSHYHKLKEETFHILYGDLNIELNGEVKEYHRGDLVLVERGAKHRFWSKNGAVFEEVSTTHYINDSYYEDPKISEVKNRKTGLTFWFED